VFGGSPFNTCLTTFWNMEHKVIAGVNLPMLLEICSNRDHMPFEALCEQAVQWGKSAIMQTCRKSLEEQQ